MLIEKLGLPRDALAGKVAVVTGAGRGIGKELARALARLGAKVVIAEIADTGAEVEALIRSEGGTARFIRTDVSDEGSIRRLAEEALREFGRVDILVNNATVVETGPILELPLSAWDRAWEVDVRAAVLAIKAFLPGMLERGEGVIVTVTSGEGMPYLAPYSATKAALSSLALSLAAELGEDSGVYAFVFAPGMVDTPGIREAARVLAPYHGITYEEFASQQANPGYEGLMPAEDCAAGFAYTIVHARRYHGQVADPFQPLAKAGLLPGARAAGLPASSLTETPVPAEILRCAQELKAALEEVNREFQELSTFPRMYARRDFQRKAGMGIEDWLEVAADLVSDLEAGGGRLRAKLPWLEENLAKLADYFRRTQKDVESFIRDPEKLAAAQEALAQREKAVRKLFSALERMS
jgi:NAD(P)-dependent dehydrogenase (short-subunit alcohol dehydrogenase family)